MTTKINEIEATLHIFSGEPNPKWILTETQVEELKEKLSLELPPDKPKLIPTGYGGFIIRNPSKVPLIPDQIHAYGGVLIVKDQGVTNCYKDVGKIEELLINQARELGYGNVIEKRQG